MGDIFSVLHNSNLKYQATVSRRSSNMPSSSFDQLRLGDQRRPICIFQVSLKVYENANPASLTAITLLFADSRGLKNEITSAVVNLPKRLVYPCSHVCGRPCGRCGAEHPDRPHLASLGASKLADRSPTHDPSNPRKSHYQQVQPRA